MIAALLALAPLLVLSETPPQIISPHATLSDCMVEAEKRNRSDESLRTNEARAKGLEYVCLHVKQWGI